MHVKMESGFEGFRCPSPLIPLIEIFEDESLTLWYRILDSGMEDDFLPLDLTRALARHPSQMVKIWKFSAGFWELQISPLSNFPGIRMTPIVRLYVGEIWRMLFSFCYRTVAVVWAMFTTTKLVYEGVATAPLLPVLLTTFWRIRYQNQRF